MRNIFILLFATFVAVTAIGCGKVISGDPATSSPKGDYADNASLLISPGEKTLPVQQATRLKATVTLADGYSEDVTEYVTWVSSNEVIATVSNEDGKRGVVRATSPGNAVLTARFDKLTGTAHITVSQYNQGALGNSAKILFLHHSTGACVWAGGIPEWFSNFNRVESKNYAVAEMQFPKSSPYGWNNYPYDYWNIWVNHAGIQPYMEEPTLEILTRSYNVIVWKHCFPVSSILPDTGKADIQSPEKRIENYKLQYQALKAKMRSFPGTRFVVWTGAALVQGATTGKQAMLARDFFEWMKTEWDEPGDNIFIWDFFALETDGGNILKNEYAAGPNDSHPNAGFSKRVAPLFCRRVVDIIDGRGDAGPVKEQ